jgi:hypothetical protein
MVLKEKLMMRWAGHMACMGVNKNYYWVLLGKT